MFENLICEVKGLNEKIIAECEKSNEITKLYKGCQIFFSPVKEKHEVMLIGINPGPGYYKYFHKEDPESDWGDKIVQEFAPLLEHEYFKNDYDLAYHVKDVFSKAKKIDKLEDSIKTNLFFLATDDESSLWKFINKLSDSLRKEILEKSKIWIQEIVKQVSPKLIICEGTGSAYNNLRNAFHGIYIEEVGYGRVKSGKINSINVLAFKRTYSIIANKTKEELIPLVEKYI
jgi:hypothetical protein